MRTYLRDADAREVGAPALARGPLAALTSDGTGPTVGLTPEMYAVRDARALAAAHGRGEIKRRARVQVDRS